MAYNPKTIIWEKRDKADEFKEKKRILIVGPASPSTGGIPSYIDDLLTSQLKDHFLLGLLDPLRVKKRIHKQESHFSLKELKASFEVLRVFLHVMRNFDPSLVHIHTSSYWGFYEKATLLAIAKTIFKKKVIMHVHGGEFDLFYRRSLCKALIEMITIWADRSLIVSKELKKSVGFDHMVHVDNSVKFDDRVLTTNKEQLREKYGIAKEKTVFLSVALLQERKGIHKTLEVFRNIHATRKDFIFIVAGEGPERENIIHFVETNRLSNNVKIYDYIFGQEKEEIFLLSDVFISNSMVESFGISILEAVSHCLFLVTTPVGIASSAANVFHGGNSIIVPIHDNEELERAILRVLDNKIDINAIAKKNFYDLKSRYDVEPVSRKISIIYEDVLGIRKSNEACKRIILQ